jgi:hypothetical protein
MLRECTIFFRSPIPVAPELGILEAGGRGAFATTDLLGRELAPANATAPGGRGNCLAPWLSLSVGTPGPDQFAAASRAQSLNHRLCAGRKIY